MSGSGNIAFNPYLTTNTQGTFSIESDGYIQGVALDDPSVRNQLAGGTLDEDETLPMWGGVAIVEDILSGAAAHKALGGNITRATTLAAMTGFSVFNQAHAMVNTPQSPVPLAAIGGQVNFYRFGSLARIPVKCSPLLASLAGSTILSQVSWDWENQMLVPYEAAYAANVVTGQTWADGVLTLTTTTAHTVGVGSVINLSGFTITAGDDFNGSHTTLALTAGSTIKIAVAEEPTVTVEGQLDAGGGALPVKVLDIQVDNCMTVTYDEVTGFATWDRDGAVALIVL